ncbi:MAG: hypothetical protein AAB356_04940, partial [Deltaproteobacteria bacterium]
IRWEAATAVAGAMLGINPFDQPDVELSKRLAMSRLEGASGAGGAVEPVGVKVQGSGFAVFFTEEAFKSVRKSRAPDPPLIPPLSRGGRGGLRRLRRFSAFLRQGIMSRSFLTSTPLTGCSIGLLRN